MDFEKVIPLIIGDFEKEGIRYALIGGFAMGAMGMVRSTMDADFLVDLGDLPKIRKIMKKYSYKCVYESENVSQFVSNIKIFGELDFLHAFRKISRSMLSRAKSSPIFAGKYKIKILRPEDIIGLKLQALANNPERENREYIDIEAIMEKFKSKLNWARLEEYFTLFQKQDKFNSYKAKYGKIN